MTLCATIHRPKSRSPGRCARCLPCTIVVVLALAACPGCSRWNWRGEGFGDGTGRWAEKMRPPADEKQFSGLDARAQEIERNLGVR
jgi:hypothetical protein